MHEQTRKSLLLLLFFVMGPILTLGILTGIVLRKMPSNARNYEYNAAMQTGLTLKIDAVEYRSLQCTRLKKVRIVDDISSKPIFVASAIDIQFVASEHLDKFFPGIETAAADSNDPIAAAAKWIKPTGFWQISAANSVFMFENDTAEASASAVRKTVAKILARFSFLSETPVQFSFENIGVFSQYSIKQPDKRPDRLQFARGNLYRTKNEIRSDWEFQAPNFSELETQHLSFVRRPSTNSTEISLRTGKMPIPCEFAAVFCSAFQRFGSGSRFSGEFVTEYKEDSNELTLRMNNAAFKDLVLDSFVKEYTSFFVSGTIPELQIDKAEFGTKKFTAAGCLQIVNGELETTLFNRFVDRFKLDVEPSDIFESPRKTIPFTACNVHFELRPDGAVFYPDERWRNAFMYKKADDSETSSMTVFFPKDNRQPVSYHTIFSILAPDTAPVVPLTPGLKGLFSMLPVDYDSNSVPLPSPQLAPLPAEPHPMIANPVTVKPTPAVLFVDPKTKQQP